MGGDRAAHANRAHRAATLTGFVDTNVLIRHLTGDPPEMAKRATAILTGPGPLLIVDLVVAECVYVLESFYEVTRPRVATLMRSALALRSVEALDRSLLLRALEVYEIERIDFAEAYLVAQAETSGVGVVVSFDRALDRVTSISRLEP